jgi:hypothetical protein
MSLSKIFADFLPAATPVEYPPDGCLYRPGEASNTLYWLQQGEVELATLISGSSRVICAPALLGIELLAEPVCRHLVRVLAPNADIRAVALPAVRERWLNDSRFRLQLLQFLSIRNVSVE